MDPNLTLSTHVELRGAIVEIHYRRTADDVTYWFAQDFINDMPLKPHERERIRQEVLAK